MHSLTFAACAMQIAKKSDSLELVSPGTGIVHGMSVRHIISEHLADDDKPERPPVPPPPETQAAAAAASSSLLAEEGDEYANMDAAAF